MEFYGRHTARRETFSYTQEIENFSTFLRMDASSTSHREYSGCDWSFIVNARGGDIVAMLGRDATGNGSTVFATVKLSIVDCFGFSRLHAEKNTRFECSSYTENVLHQDGNRLLNGYCGLNRLLYVPNDTLILRWEITTCEFCDQRFDDRKDEFEEDRPRSPGGFFRKGRDLSLLKLSLLCLWCTLVIALSFAVLAGIVLCVYNFLLATVIPFLKAIAAFIMDVLTGCCLIAALLGLIKICNSLQRGNNNHLRLTQIERRQLFLPNNRGVLRYENIRCIGYNNSHLNRYPNRNYNRLW